MALPQTSLENVASVLHLCTKTKQTARALRLHVLTCKIGVQGHTVLGNPVVSMLVAVGRMDMAQEAFDRASYRNDSIWNSLMNGYIEQGESRQALILYHKMQEESLQPESSTLVALLKACIKMKDVEAGCNLHVDICKTGLLDVDPFVGSALVSMYAKFGLVEQAQDTFDNLPIHTAVTWNALIAAYVQNSRSEDALECYRNMRRKGISPNAATVTCILKACSNIGAVDMGREIHTEIVESGLLLKCPSIGGMVIDMYAKCQSLSKAQEVFDMLPIRDIMSWTALIAGHVQNEHCEEAMKYFEQMQDMDVSPNAVTFACSLKASGATKAVDKGLQIHAAVVRLGLLKDDLFVCSALVDMYAKWGMMVRAQEVFDMLLVDNVVTWTALISGYVQHDQGEEALRCYDQMQSRGVPPNAATYTCSMKACGSICAAGKGSQIHKEVAAKGLLKTEVCVGSALVDMYAKCGLLTKAQELFDTLPVRNVVTWSALIMGYVQHNCSEEALGWFEQMQRHGVSPNAVTYACSLKACSNIRSIEKGIEIHTDVARKDLLHNDVLIGSTLVDMYAKCGSLDKSEEVFGLLRSQNAVTFNAMIAAYVEHEHGEEALELYERMKHDGLSPNAASYACILKASGSVGAIDKAGKIHVDVGTTGLLRTDPFVSSAMIDMYSKCGLLTNARTVFEMITVRNLIHWSGLITAYSQLGEIEDTVILFERMIEEGHMPDSAIFIAILNACSHAGLVDRGQAYFKAMSDVYGISPTLRHYICIMDLFGRAGQLDMGVVTMTRTPCHPNTVMCLSMLGACRKQGNVELGRDVYQQATQSDMEEASAYVCMSNIYAEADVHTYWQEATDMEIENDW